MNLRDAFIYFFSGRPLSTQKGQDACARIRKELERLAGRYTGKGPRLLEQHGVDVASESLERLLRQRQRFLARDPRITAEWVIRHPKAYLDQAVRSRIASAMERCHLRETISLGPGEAPLSDSDTGYVRLDLDLSDALDRWLAEHPGRSYLSTTSF